MSYKLKGKFSQRSSTFALKKEIQLLKINLSIKFYFHNKMSQRNKAETKDVDAWKTARFNIAVVGIPNTTKSLFVHKIACVDFEDATSSVDTQIRPSEQDEHDYVFINCKRHGNNDQFYVWDLKPFGGGSSNASVDEYMADIKAEQFDVFILLREANGFDDKDQELAKAIKQLNKSVYFVQIDTLENEQAREEDHVFHFKSVADDSALSKLNLAILNDLEDNDKKRVFTFSIEPLSAEILATKSLSLYARLHDIAVKSTMIGHLLSAPGVTIIADLCVLSAEVWFYKEQLGLSKSSLLKMKSSAVDLYEKAVEIVEGSKYSAYLVLSDIHAFSGLILNTIPLLQNSSVIEMVAMAPVLSMALNDTKSFATVKQTLMCLLDEFCKIAGEIQALKSEAANRGFKRIEGNVSSQYQAVQ
jgi:hypothetical protein